MDATFPPEVYTAAAHHAISPALAFGLGEGLNLFYSRRLHEVPPHRLHVLPSTFAARLAERIALPRAPALQAALHSNALGVLVCTGDWHGLDAIEKWAEELPRWPMHPGYEQSITRFADYIEVTDALYRTCYLDFLDEAGRLIGGLEPARAMLEEVAAGWLDIAQRLHARDDLERISRRLLRQAALESRFWGLIHQATDDQGPKVWVR